MKVKIESAKFNRRGVTLFQGFVNQINQFSAADCLLLPLHFASFVVGGDEPSVRLDGDVHGLVADYLLIISYYG